MLLTHGVGASSVQIVDLFTICCFEWAKGANITRLKLMRGMRGQTAEDDVVLEAELQQLQRLVGRESVVDEHSWLTICAGSCPRIKYFSNPM